MFNDCRCNLWTRYISTGSVLFTVEQDTVEQVNKAAPPVKQVDVPQDKVIEEESAHPQQEAEADESNGTGSVY